MPIFLGIFSGLILGSFASALGTRIYHDKTESMVRDRSSCPQCQHQLSWYDLIPLVSYLSTGGKCRYCSKPISGAYITTEIIGAVLGAFVVIQYYGTSSLIGWLSLIIVLLTLIFIDLRWQVVPDMLVYVAAILVALITLDSQGSLVSLMFGAGLSAMIIGLIVSLTQGRAMGSGDIGVAAFLGGLVGFSGVLPGMLVSFILGGAWGGILLATKRATMKTAVAFAPFLIVGFVLVYLVGGYHN